MTPLVVLLVLAGGGAPEPWAFEDGRALVFAKGTPRDGLSSAALQQLGLELQGPLTLAVSARANTVGGVTLRLSDPADPKAFCDLYAMRVADGSLRFDDSRCSFAAFSGRLKTTATCRRITGTAKKLDDGKVALEARSPDCNAQPLGLPLTISGTLTPR